MRQLSLGLVEFHLLADYPKACHIASSWSSWSKEELERCKVAISLMVERPLCLRQHRDGVERLAA
jgi:hypothetical protein